MVNPSNFFDLYDVWVNELVGDVWLAIIVSMVVVTYISIKTKMPYEMTILLNILLLTIWFAETFIIIIWVFVVLAVGALFYYGINKALQGR